MRYEIAARAIARQGLPPNPPEKVLRDAAAPIIFDLTVNVMPLFYGRQREAPPHG